VIRQLFQFGFEVPLFFVEKTLPVGDEILKVADLWPVDGRIVNFGDDAVPKGKPNPAGSCIGSSHAILTAMRPSGLGARPSKSLLVGFVSHSMIRLLWIALDLTDTAHLDGDTACALVAHNPILV
jgi:hypothetical protein